MQGLSITIRDPVAVRRVEITTQMQEVTVMLKPEYAGRDAVIVIGGTPHDDVTEFGRRLEIVDPVDVRARTVQGVMIRGRPYARVRFRGFDDLRGMGAVIAVTGSMDRRNANEPE